ARRSMYRTPPTARPVNPAVAPDSARPRLDAPTISTSSPALPIHVQSQSSPGGGRVHHEEVIERASLCVPETQGRDEIAMPSVHEPVCEQRGPLCSLFGRPGEAAKRHDLRGAAETIVQRGVHLAGVTPRQDDLAAPGSGNAEGL